MRKLTLHLENLQVESFHTHSAMEGPRGTVQANLLSRPCTGGNTCVVACYTETCGPSCPGSCGFTCPDTCGISCVGTCETCEFSCGGGGACQSDHNFCPITTTNNA